MAKVEWDERKIEKFVSDGWSLSYDKANDRFKLQKRVKGKVKSYSLPKQFNEFCWKLKEELKLTKGKPLKEVFKAIENKENNLIDLTCVDTFNLSWDQVDEVLEKYCKEKAESLSPKEVAKMALYSYLILKKSGGARVNEILLFADSHEDMIRDLEDRVDDIAYGLRQVLGNTEIGFTCPKCGEWTHLELREVEIGGKRYKRWVCAKCGEVPF